MSVSSCLHTFAVKSFKTSLRRFSFWKFKSYSKLKMLGKKIKRAAVNNQLESEGKKKHIKKSHKSSETHDITSPFFDSMPLWQKLFDVECRMSAELKVISFLSSTISAVYNPIEYAADLHCAYLKKFLNNRKPVVFIGMNPGPFGMVQTGVPFGHVPAVRDWMKLSGAVKKPENELPVRPVTGLLCDKSEQSGQRFWGLWQQLCGDKADDFFRNCFVHNLCPLALFHASGRNITPAELKTDKKKLMQDICTKYLKEAIDLLSPELIVSVGRYAEDRVKELYKTDSIDSRIQHKCIPHPSPRALNNTNWNEKAKQWLIDNDVMKYINAE